MKIYNVRWPFATDFIFFLQLVDFVYVDGDVYDVIAGYLQFLPAEYCTNS